MVTDVGMNILKDKTKQGKCFGEKFQKQKSMRSAIIAQPSCKIRIERYFCPTF